MTKYPNLEELIEHVRKTLPGEPRQDALWRHAILSRQVGQAIGVAITHHAQLSPDARPYHGIEDAQADVLSQALFFIESMNIGRTDLEKVAELALGRMKNRVWETTLTTKIDGLPTGTLAHPWTPGDQPFYGVIVHMEDGMIGPTDTGRNNILYVHHLDNDNGFEVQQAVKQGKIQMILTQQGGMLCHAAIIAREDKVPAVVGLGSSVHLDQGQRVLVGMDHQTQRAYVKVL